MKRQIFPPGLSQRNNQPPFGIARGPGFLNFTVIPNTQPPRSLGSSEPPRASSEIHTAPTGVRGLGRQPSITVPRGHAETIGSESLPAAGAGAISDCAKALLRARTGLQGVGADHAQSRRKGTALRTHFSRATPSRRLQNSSQHFPGKLLCRLCGKRH